MIRIALEIDFQVSALNERQYCLLEVVFFFSQLKVVLSVLKERKQLYFALRILFNEDLI